MFFGLPEKKALENSAWEEDPVRGTKDARPGNLFKKQVEISLEKLRIRYPEKSRVQRLYFNANTVTVGAVLTLCTVMRVQSTVLHIIIDSIATNLGVEGLSLSVLGKVILVVSLTDLANRYQVIAVSQILPSVAVFLAVGSMVI